MAIKGLTVSSGKVYQELDLSEIFGVGLDGQEALKLAICQDIIDYMRDRTARGIDHNGQSFARYSASYKESDEFEAFGKTGKVNMQLRGDMLTSLDFETSGDSVKFLFDDAEEETKAFGHMSGMEGHKHLDGKTPKRLFFGISPEEIKEKVLPKFKDDIDALKKSKADVGLGAFLSLEEALGFKGGSSSSQMTLEDLLKGI